MTLPCKDMFYNFAPDSGYGSPETVRFLLNVVAGVEGGRLLGIPWHVLPLIRAFVKERLALAAFSICHCSYPSASWFSGCNVGANLSREGSQKWVLGFLCTGWQEGAVGTLACTDRLGGSVLQQEIAVLKRVISASWVENQDCIVHPLHKQFACIAISVDAGNMTQAGENTGLQDIKKKLRRLYEMTAIGIMDNKEMAKEIKKWAKP